MKDIVLVKFNIIIVENFSMLGSLFGLVYA
jgi:hypothetical protein